MGMATAVPPSPAEYAMLQCYLGKATAVLPSPTNVCNFYSNAVESYLFMSFCSVYQGKATVAKPNPTCPLDVKVRTTVMLLQ